MAGVKLGDRLLVIGCGDPLLIAHLALKTGLTGRAFAVDENQQAVAAAAETAAREGALIETAVAPWNGLPLDSDSFDVTVVRDILPYLGTAARAQCISEAHRLLRPGGRCLVIDGKGRGRRAAIVRDGAAASGYSEAEGPVQVLLAQGFKAARVLAEREGMMFAEAIKPAS